jgi:hypothetical protein
LPQRGPNPYEGTERDRRSTSAPSPEELFDDLAVLLKKRGSKVITED